MLKNGLNDALDWIWKHSLVVFPLIVGAAAAVTVALALNAKNAGELLKESKSTVSGSASTGAEPSLSEQEVPLVENTDENIRSLILSFYNAAALGDMATLSSLCDQMTDEEYFRYQELAKYIEFYPTVEIYSKPGLEEKSTLAFVYFKQTFVDHEEELPGWQAFYICADGDGKLYIKRGGFTQEQDDYIRRVSLQDDVKAFNNRVNVEYNEVIFQQPQWVEYMDDMKAKLETAVGVQIAKKNAEAELTKPNPAGTEPGGQTQEGEKTRGQAPGAETPANTEPVVQYVVTNATVNVRSSDSTNADRLGTAEEGRKLELKEAQVNGWSRIVFEGQDAFIKSEYLDKVESEAGLTAVGTVTATTNVNVRAAADAGAERLGVLAGGEKAELYAKENGWCKIKYNGQIGYVKEDYVQ